MDQDFQNFLQKSADLILLIDDALGRKRAAPGESDADQRTAKQPKSTQGGKATAEQTPAEPGEAGVFSAQAEKPRDSSALSTDERDSDMSRNTYSVLDNSDSEEEEPRTPETPGKNVL